jgi:hypothetical protein
MISVVAICLSLKQAIWATFSRTEADVRIVRPLSLAEGQHVLLLFSRRPYATIPVILFVPGHEELSDNEIAEVLRQSIASAGRLPRTTSGVALTSVRKINRM